MDGDSLLLTCNVWRQTAEDGAEGLARGMRVIVSAACGSGTIKPSDRTYGAERPALFPCVIEYAMTLSIGAALTECRL
jgi:hypothetical protein